VEEEKDQAVGEQARGEEFSQMMAEYDSVFETDRELEAAAIKLQPIATAEQRIPISLLAIN